MFSQPDTQPPLALELARRNKLEHLLPFSTVEGAAKAYSYYDNLQEFLDLRDATLSVIGHAPATAQAAMRDPLVGSVLSRKHSQWPFGARFVGAFRAIKARSLAGVGLQQ